MPLGNSGSLTEMKRFLPPASEGWGKVIFSVCVSVHIDGERGGGRVPHPLMEGTPFPGPGRGVPLPRSGGVPLSRQGE